MSRSILLALISLALTVGSTQAEARDQSPRRPNVLLILADDMGFSDLGSYGGEIATPNLDRLAAGGLRFTSFYNTARCWPTRASVLTGYYAQQVRMDPPQGPLPAWTRVLPHYLKPIGYHSYQSGKWHLMGAPRVVADGGFDRSYKLDDHDRHFDPKRHTLDDRPLPPVEPESGYYSTTAIAQHAIDFLKEHSEKHPGEPFLQYLAFTSPHFPIQAPSEDIERYRDRYLVGWDAIREERWKRLRELGILDSELSDRDPITIPAWNLSEDELHERIGPGEVGHAVAWSDLTEDQKRFQAEKMAVHAAMIDRMDREIGRVLKQLETMGVLDDTLIFFASDNGASPEQIIRGDGHDPSAPVGSAATFLGIGPGWSTAANTPFRLHKSWVHEGGIATPLIVHWPRGIAARGELRHEVGHVIDFLPTLLELVDVQPEPIWNDLPAPPLPGRSLVPAFAADGQLQRDFLFFSHIGNRALREGDWKIASAKEFENRWELYNLAVDRAEEHDLAAEQSERVQRMAQRWTQLSEQFVRQAGPNPSEKPKP